jgi:hypothetical protein
VEEHGFYLGSPTSEEGLAAGAEKHNGQAPAADLAALLASPPHGGIANRRPFSRQGSGLSRLISNISKNWESEVVSLLLLW